MSSTLGPYYPTSWFHPIGIRKVLNRIKHRLPNVENCLFITLTINPHFFEDESSGFKRSRDRIRRIFNRLKTGVKWNDKIIQINAAYATKVEFHENGWPHFHIIFLSKRYLPRELIDHLWGYGWTKVDRIKQESFESLLKYVTKHPSLPEWVLERKRLRIFQTSHGFLLPDEKKKKPTSAKESKKESTRRESHTIGERIEKWESKATLTSEAGMVQTIDLPYSFKKTFDHLILEIAQDGRYLGDSKIIINDRKEMVIWIKTSNQLRMNQECSFEE